MQNPQEVAGVSLEQPANPVIEDLQAIFNSKPEIATAPKLLAKFEELGVFDLKKCVDEGKIQVDSEKEIKRNLKDSDGWNIDG